MPISLGSITFGIGPDTTRLRQSIGDITNFGNAVEAAARAAAAGANNGAAALMRQEQAAISALQKVQKFQDQIAKSAAPTNLAAGFNNLSTQSLDRFVQRMTSGQLSAIQFQREMERLGVSMTNAQRIFQQWNNAQKTSASDAMVESLRKLSGAAVLVYGPLSGVATRISVIASLAEHFSLSWAAAIVGVAAGAAAFFKLSESVIASEKALQGISATLTAVTGSSVIAQTQMKYLADLSDRSGVAFVDLAKEYSQVTAAAKGTNLEGERTNKIFESIVFAGAKLNLSNEEVGGTLKAIQQIISKGTIQLEELKGQLGDRLPGAMQIMATAMGVTTQKLQVMIKAGDVGASNLTKFADALTKRYNIDTTANIDTITAAETRLSNARLKMIDSIDKILGISTAYKNTLNAITAAINGQSPALASFIAVLGGVATAFAAAFASSAVVAGLGAIAGGIRAVTISIAAMNIAATAGAAGGLLKALATLGIAMAAGYAGFKLTEDAMKGTQQSFLDALPPVNSYIDAQRKLTSSVMKPTLDYLTEEQAKLKALTQTREEAAAAATKALTTLDEWEKMGTTGPQIDKMGIGLGLPELEAKLKATDAAISKTKANIKDLNNILTSQLQKEETDRKDPAKELTNSQNVSLKNASDTIKELKQEYDNLFKSPAAKEWDTTQLEINKKIENFRDQLTRAQIPAEKVVQLTTQYGEALRKVKEGEISLKNYTSYFQAVEGIFSRGLDTAMNQFVQNITEGKAALSDFQNVWKAVAADILKTMLTLAAVNPLKNVLFGTNSPTLGGSAGVGGVLGNLATSIFGAPGGGVTASSTTGIGGIGHAANGGLMTSKGMMPLKSYSGGGVANSPQYAEFGEGRLPEAYVPLPDGRSIPVSMKGGGGGSNVQVNIINNSGSQVEHKNYQSGGVDFHDVIIGTVSKAFMNNEFQNVGGRNRSRRR